MKDPIESLQHLDPELEETDIPQESKPKRNAARPRVKSIRSSSSFNTMGVATYKLNATSRATPPCPPHLLKPLKPISSCTGMQKR